MERFDFSEKNARLDPRLVRRLRQLPRAATLLVAANVLYFLYLSVQGSTLSGSFMLAHGALYAPAVIRGGEYYRLFTALFMHFGLEHLFFNMLLLLYMGMVLEEAIGPVRFLLIYLVCGLLGNAASLAYYWMAGENVVSAGASGAIFAMVGVCAWIIWRHHGYYHRIGLRQIGLMIVFSLYNGFLGSGTNNVAHIAGLLSGFLCGVLCYRGGGKR